MRTIVLPIPILLALACRYDLDAVQRPVPFDGRTDGAAAPDVSLPPDAAIPEASPPPPDTAPPPDAVPPPDTAGPEILADVESPEAPAADGKVAYCGGTGHTPCPAEQFCDVVGMCGNTDASGTCVAKPKTLSDCAGMPPAYVCACSGEEYTNDCVRIFWGRWKKWDGKCA
jgi:hypothetical protein